MLLLTLLFVTGFQNVWGQGSYTILAPRIIRPFSAYNILIGVDNLSTQTIIDANLTKIEGNVHHWAGGGVSMNADQNQFQQLPLNVGNDWEEGSYELTISLKGGINSNQTFKIEYYNKRNVIMVQSDKAIYRPGEDVNFRIVFLDNELKPTLNSEIKDLKIYIMDPFGFKLKQYLMHNEETKQQENVYKPNIFNYSMGVTDDIKFNLPEEAPLGEWIIQTVTKGQIENYTIMVDYYSTEMANITINMPNFIEHDEILNFTVYALYTFGKPVHGVLDMTISIIGKCGHKVNSTDLWENSTLINGQDSFNLDLKDVLINLRSEECNEFNFNFSAVIKDDKTGSLYKNHHIFHLIANDILVEVDNKNIYHPWKPVVKKIKLYKKSGDLIKKEEMNNIVCVSFVLSKFNPIPVRREGETLIKGDGEMECEYEFDPALELEMNISLILKNDNIESRLFDKEIHFERNCMEDTWIYLSQKNKLEDLSVGRIVKLSIKSSHLIHDIIYYIVIRGSITKSEPIKFESPLRNQEIDIKLTRNMIPQAYIVVYMKTSNNLILSDAILFNVKGDFLDDVNIEVETPLLDAGGQAIYKVTAKKNSRVFLLGNDVGLLTVRDGNDLSHERLIDQLTYINKFSNIVDGFAQSGMILITNGVKECQDNIRVDVLPDDDEDVIERRIRSDFRETWIWDQILMPHNKESVRITEIVPDSITSWKLTGFSLSTTGIGLTKIPAYVQVFREFFVRLSLPNYLKRNETSEVHLTLFNYYNESLGVSINLRENYTQAQNLIFYNCEQVFELKSNEIKTISCQIQSLDVGHFRVIAEANAVSLISDRNFHDGEERNLKIIYEGNTLNYAQTIFFDLTHPLIEQDPIQKSFDVTFPDDRVLGSETVLFSASSDYITVDFSNDINRIRDKFDRINFNFQTPHGCCQQNIRSYYVQAYWMKYLKTTLRAKPEDLEQASIAVQNGINKLCHNTPRDGSFTFYPGHNRPFLWLTAYTLKFMSLAKNITTVSIQDGDIHLTLDWLKNKQSTSGEFVETDHEHSLYRSPNNAFLTSYVRAVMYENGHILNNPADTWMSTIFDSLSDPIEIMVTCYALNVVKHEKRASCYAKIEQMIQTNDNGKYWKGQDGEPNLMVTAYGLMIISMHKDLVTGLEVFKFLASRQDAFGGFVGLTVSGANYGLENFPTIICTEAMTMFVEIMNQYEFKRQNILITFEQDHGTPHNMLLRDDDQVLKIVEGNASIDQVSVFGKGFGRAKATIYTQFNTIKDQEGDFDINVSQDNVADGYAVLHICASYKLDGDVNNGIIEIELPSGYKYDKEQFKNSPELIDKIESKRDDTWIIIYLKKIDSEPICFDIPVIESHSVINRHPCVVRAYSFYDRSRMSLSNIDIQ